MIRPDDVYYVPVTHALEEWTQEGAIIISNIDEDIPRAEAIQWFCEAVYRIATGLGATPDDPKWTQTQAIDAHVIYMTNYVNELRKLNEVITKADNARNN